MIGTSLSLRPYQQYGAAFLSVRPGALLADEMGLGKTAQAATAIRSLIAPRGGRALVVCPTSLMSNWVKELRAWTPDLSVRALRGDAQDRLAILSLPVHIVIASYEQVRLHQRELARLARFEVVVLDEAQRIKNRHSLTSHACKSIPRRRSWALTGTPVENRDEDIVAVFTFVAPGLLHAGMPTAELHDGMRDHFLRRRQVEVLPELPPVIDQELTIDLTRQQRREYDLLWESRDELAGNAPDAPGLLALITKLKLACNRAPDSEESAKLEALKDILESVDPKARVVVFSQYVDTLAWLEPRLADASDTWIYHGGLGEAERDRVLSEFLADGGQGGERPRTLLMSLRAGGVGLNLQPTNVVVLFDRWWNPAVEAQAVGRALRFGRASPLHVIRFLCDSTIEQRIDEVLREKQNLFEELVNEAPSAGVSSGLSKQDLARVLDLQPGPKMEEL